MSSIVDYKLEVQCEIVKIITKLKGTYRIDGDRLWKLVEHELNLSVAVKNYNWKQLLIHYKKKLIHQLDASIFHLKELDRKKMRYPFLKELFRIDEKFVDSKSVQTEPLSGNLLFKYKAIIKYKLHKGFNEDIYDDYERINPSRKLFECSININIVQLNLSPADITSLKEIINPSHTNNIKPKKANPINNNVWLMKKNEGYSKNTHRTVIGEKMYGITVSNHTTAKEVISTNKENSKTASNIIGNKIVLCQKLITSSTEINKANMTKQSEALSAYPIIEQNSINSNGVVDSSTPSLEQISNEISKVSFDDLWNLSKYIASTIPNICINLNKPSIIPISGSTSEKNVIAKNVSVSSNEKQHIVYSNYSTSSCSNKKKEVPQNILASPSMKSVTNINTTDNTIALTESIREETTEENVIITQNVSNKENQQSLYSNCSKSLPNKNEEDPQVILSSSPKTNSTNINKKGTSTVLEAVTEAETIETEAVHEAIPPSIKRRQFAMKSTSKNIKISNNLCKTTRQTRVPKTAPIIANNLSPIHDGEIKVESTINKYLRKDENDLYLPPDSSSEEESENVEKQNKSSHSRKSEREDENVVAKPIREETAEENLIVTQNVNSKENQQSVCSNFSKSSPNKNKEVLQDILPSPPKNNFKNINTKGNSNALETVTEPLRMETVQGVIPPPIKRIQFAKKSTSKIINLDKITKQRVLSAAPILTNNLPPILEGEIKDDSATVVTIDPDKLSRSPFMYARKSTSIRSRITKSQMNCVDPPKNKNCQLNSSEHIPIKSKNVLNCAPNSIPHKLGIRGVTLTQKKYIQQNMELLTEVNSDIAIMQNSSEHIPMNSQNELENTAKQVPYKSRLRIIESSTEEDSDIEIMLNSSEYIPVKSKNAPNCVPKRIPHKPRNCPITLSQLKNMESDNTQELINNPIDQSIEEPVNISSISNRKVTKNRGITLRQKKRNTNFNKFVHIISNEGKKAPLEYLIDEDSVPASIEHVAGPSRLFGVVLRGKNENSIQHIPLVKDNQKPSSVITDSSDVDSDDSTKVTTLHKRKEQATESPNENKKERRRTSKTKKHSSDSACEYSIKVTTQHKRKEQASKSSNIKMMKKRRTRQTKEPSTNVITDSSDVESDEATKVTTLHKGRERTSKSPNENKKRRTSETKKHSTNDPTNIDAIPGPSLICDNYENTTRNVHKVTNYKKQPIVESAINNHLRMDENGLYMAPDSSSEDESEYTEHKQPNKSLHIRKWRRNDVNPFARLQPQQSPMEYDSNDERFGSDPLMLTMYGDDLGNN